MPIKPVTTPAQFTSKQHMAHDLHTLHSNAASKELAEAVGETFVTEGLLKARTRTLQLAAQIRGSLTEGMTERDANAMALQVSTDAGARRFWHKPYVRLGPGTLLNFNHPIAEDYRLQRGNLCYLDIGPVWPDDHLALSYEGDYGDSFVYGDGANAEATACAQTARDLFIMARDYWRQTQATGVALYQFLDAAAHERGYATLENVHGHRIGNFPHNKYHKKTLGEFAFTPSAALWVLEVHIKPAVDAQFGAFFEDLLLPALV